MHHTAKSVINLCTIMLQLPVASGWRVGYAGEVLMSDDPNRILPGNSLPTLDGKVWDEFPAEPQQPALFGVTP